MKPYTLTAPSTTCLNTDQDINGGSTHQTIQNISITVFSAFLLSSISACSSIPAIQDRPSTTQIEPINQPVWNVGYVKKLVNTQTGESAGYEILETDTELGMHMASMRSDREGCQWTDDSDWFPQPPVGLAVVQASGHPGPKR